MVVPGPAIFGRSVVVASPDAVPSPWAGTNRVVLDEAALAAPADVVALLHRAWAERQPLTIVAAVDPAVFRPPRSWTVEPWQLGADFEPWDDRLQFLVWANSYDARVQLGRPVWWWARKAVRLGAREPAGPDGPGDVVLPDGRPAWIDGGPREPYDLDEIEGAFVVHRESVECSILRPALSRTGRFGPSRPVPTAAKAVERSLAEDQKAAVAHHRGPARVLAPAGSGKTRVLTERLRHLLAERRWEPDTVLAVAYNKKAQEELDGRTAGLGARIRTLNALGLSLLAAGRSRAPEVLDERAARRLVERLVPLRRHRANTDPIGPYLEGLSAVRLGLRSPGAVEATRDDVPGLAELFPAYRSALRASGAVDFDEQIYAAIERLLADGEFRRGAQQACRHLLVDEFQDLTPAHVLLLRLLALPGLDVFGVGDDDQVIYGHAGADPRFLLDYVDLFPGAADHRLEVNYRCPPAVVNAATNLLSYNERRVDKTIRPAPGRAETAGALTVREHAPADGAATVAEVVQSWLDHGARPASVAVLARVHALLMAPHVALSEAGVPISSVVRPDVMERTGVRAALAYLRLAGDDHLGAGDLIEILRRPSRGLPPWFADRLRRRPTWTTEKLFEVAGTVGAKDAAKIERLADDLVALRAVGRRRGTTTERLLRFIRHDVGLGGAMTLLDGNAGGEGSSHLDDLDALDQVAGLHPEPATFDEWLRAAVGRVGDPTGVTLSTVHRVKGMEWDQVVLYGANAGIMPHRLAGDDEEERRVLHVALTRCREKVVVLADRVRPSPFLLELAGTAARQPAIRAVRPPGSPVNRTREPAGSSPRANQRANQRANNHAEPPGSADPAVEEALRAWRRERSGRDRVPAYIVASDRTLAAIAWSSPGSLPDLLAVDGIGPTKLELYGEEILAVIARAKREDRGDRVAAEDRKRITHPGNPRR
jgi:DNA helicase-2/ATP-dependent DNA helicase PcrA